MSLGGHFDVVFPLNLAMRPDLGKIMDFAGFGVTAKMIRKITEIRSFPLDTFDCSLRSQVFRLESMISPGNVA
jgi:hypothetical protein